MGLCDANAQTDVLGRDDESVLVCFRMFESLMRATNELMGTHQRIRNLDSVGGVKDLLGDRVRFVDVRCRFRTRLLVNHNRIVLVRVRKSCSPSSLS